VEISATLGIAEAKNRTAVGRGRPKGCSLCLGLSGWTGTIVATILSVAFTNVSK
jgi:hypothetical protein